MRHMPANVRELAANILTEAQHEAWILETRGITQRGISWHLDISRSAVLDRLDGAHRKLRKAGVRQDLATGDYYLEACTFHVGCRATQHHEGCPLNDSTKETNGQVH